MAFPKKFKKKAQVTCDFFSFKKNEGSFCSIQFNGEKKIKVENIKLKANADDK